MNNKLRKQFENIAEIKEMLLNNDELKWCDESKRYINSRVFQDAETSYINGALFGWIQSANREGYKLVDKKKLAKVLNCVTDDWLIDTGAMNEFKEIESLVADEVEFMIGAIE